MLESTIEQYLVRRIKAAGGLALKWSSPSFAGVPDRIVFLPGGRVFFCELKAPGKSLSALQTRVVEILRGLGARVVVVDSRRGVDALVDEQ